MWFLVFAVALAAAFACGAGYYFIQKYEDGTPPNVLGNNGRQA
jgi:hypothetical protein